MPAPNPETSGVDEFEAIARLLRPLAADAPEALDLADDAAVVPPRPGFELVVSADAMVAGVHFLEDDPLDLVARKLLRVNLSDLAAKGAEPYAYLLAAAWPASCGWPERQRFVRGLREDQEAYGIKLLGGDTSSTPGPLTLSLTILGWTPRGAMVRRTGAQPGHRVLVSGTIGDGWLGLQAAQGRLEHLGEGAGWLADRYRLPRPRVELIEALRANATAAADVSDGLIADAGHVAEASGVGLVLQLGRLPLSAAAEVWVERQPDRARSLMRLASGGDDYEVVCTCVPGAARDLIAEAGRAGIALADVGEVVEGARVRVELDGIEVPVERTGWRHS